MAPSSAKDTVTVLCPLNQPQEMRVGCTGPQKFFELQSSNGCWLIKSKAQESWLHPIAWASVGKQICLCAACLSEPVLPLRCKYQYLPWNIVKMEEPLLSPTFHVQGRQCQATAGSSHWSRRNISKCCLISVWWGTCKALATGLSLRASRDLTPLMQA